MTITREPLCQVRDCPYPTDPDWHVPHCGHGLEGEHQHFPKRSQGGKEVVAFLCHDCHHETDNGLWTDCVTDVFGERRYVIMDIHGNTLLERVIDNSNGASAANGLATDPPELDAIAEALTEYGTGEEPRRTDGRKSTSPVPTLHPTIVAMDAPIMAMADRQVTSAAPSLLGWLDQGYALSESGRDAPWHWGDWGLEGEAVFGEDFWQHVTPMTDGWQDDEGWHAPVINVKTLANRMWVASRFPPALRVSGLTHGHHKAVAGLGPTEAVALLSAALDGRWPVSALTAAVKELDGVPRRDRTFTREQVKAILVRYKDALPLSMMAVRRTRLGYMGRPRGHDGGIHEPREGEA